MPPECIKALSSGYASFGASGMPTKSIIGKLSSLVEAGRKETRTATFDLMEEMTRWITAMPFNPLLEGVREATRKELDERLKAVEVVPRQPTIGFRSNQAAMAAASDASAGASGTEGGAGSGPGGAGAAAAPAALDPFEFLPEVDLLALYPKSEFMTLANEAKWNLKKQGLDLLIGLCGEPPKLKAGNYNDLLRLVKPLLQDSHQQVSATALRLVGCIARGLRTSFGPSCADLVQFRLVTSRLKVSPRLPVKGTARHEFFSFFFSALTLNPPFSFPSLTPRLAGRGRKRSLCP